MATLDSVSSDQDIWDAYDDNASYEEDDSAAKAKIFITACRILLRRRPQRMSTNGYAVDFDDLSVREEMSRARDWLSVNQASGESVRHLSFSRLRD